MTHDGTATGDGNTAAEATSRLFSLLVSCPNSIDANHRANVPPTGVSYFRERSQRATYRKIGRTTGIAQGVLHVSELSRMQ